MEQNSRERQSRIYAMPWVPPLMKGQIKSFLYKEGRQEKYLKNSVIVSEDDYLSDIFIVKSGILSNSIIHHALSKSFTMCGIRIAGHISGYTTFLLRDPAPVRIMALSKAEIYRVSFAQMDRFLEESPELKNEFVRCCCRCLRSEIDALLAMTTIPVEERFWVLMASLFLAMSIAPDGSDWLSLPFKINRETMSCLLYVNIGTIDRLYSALVKNNLMMRSAQGYSLKAEAVNDGVRWIEARYGVE